MGIGGGHMDFIVTTDGVLMPLGVKVLRDSREELLPSTREAGEIIPLRHGEISFGNTFNSRQLELSVVTEEGIDKITLKRAIAKHLVPEIKTLIFMDDPDKMYLVKYAGKIELNQYSKWFSFVVPFKMMNPFILETQEREQVGSGILRNEGTMETPVAMEIRGPATNPTISINDKVLKYTGTLASGDVVIIQTEQMTVTYNGVNALANYNNEFPLLSPGETTVTAGNNVTFRWRSRWL